MQITMVTCYGTFGIICCYNTVFQNFCQLLSSAFLHVYILGVALVSVVKEFSILLGVQLCFRRFSQKFEALFLNSDYLFII